MENNTCHGCGNKYDDCICEELDAERDEGKYPDDDPNDGDYDVEDEAEEGGSVLFRQPHVSGSLPLFKCKCGYETYNSVAWCVHADCCNGSAFTITPPNVVLDCGNAKIVFDKQQIQVDDILDVYIKKNYLNTFNGVYL